MLTNEQICKYVKIFFFFENLHIGIIYFLVKIIGKMFQFCCKLFPVLVNYFSNDFIIILDWNRLNFLMHLWSKITPDKFLNLRFIDILSMFITFLSGLFQLVFRKLVEFKLPFNEIFNISSFYINIYFLSHPYFFWYKCKRVVLGLSR